MKVGQVVWESVNNVFILSKVNILAKSNSPQGNKFRLTESRKEIQIDRKNNATSPVFICKSGAHLGGRGIHPLPSKRKVSLDRLFAPNMPYKDLK